MKNLFLATVLAVGVASIGIAQLSNGRSNRAVAGANVVNANGLSGFNLQDTTKKPVKDTIPPKKDSTSKQS